MQSFRLLFKATFRDCRCLLEDHCANLTNTACLSDPVLQAGTGIDTYMTCQCRDGFAFNPDTKECVVGKLGLPVPCQEDNDCQLPRYSI